MSAREPIPATIRERVMVDAGFRCHYCNRVGHRDIGPGERPWHIDHKHPVVKGGTNDRDNLVLACKRCNLTKNARDYDEFAAYARLAYWVDDSQDIAGGVLDALAEAWANAYSTGRAWSHVEYIEAPTANAWDDVLVESVYVKHDGSLEETSRGTALRASRDDGAHLARFALLAMRHMPNLLAMVAEARESRAAA